MLKSGKIRRESSAFYINTASVHLPAVFADVRRAVAAVRW
jgi:hypothetical protein